MSNQVDRDSVLDILNIVRQDPSQIDNAIDEILSLPPHSKRVSIR